MCAITATSHIVPEDPDFAVEVDSATSTRDATTVRLRVEFGGHFGGPNTEIFYVEGTSKRDPRDRPNQEIAHRLALARALERAVKRLERPALGAVKHADDLMKGKK
jgi:hypothetical protein